MQNAQKRDGKLLDVSSRNEFFLCDRVLIFVSFVFGARHYLKDEICEFYALYRVMRKGSALNSMLTS